MKRIALCCVAFLLLASPAWSDEKDKKLAGMSIVGNDEAPKSLVIVPWKSAGLSDVLDVGSSLGDGRAPVDREVFMRELDYYQIRVDSPGGGPGTP